VRATVVTTRATIDGRNFDQDLLIAGSRARFTGEHDLWRLYDTKANTITFVDDVARTVRTKSLQEMLAERRAKLTAPLAAHFPRARIARSTNTKLLHRSVARETVIEAGGYRREIWFGEHPSIPRGIFMLMHASDEVASPLAPMMSAVDEVLTAERGFPLEERSTVGGRVIAERSVIRIAQRDVPQAALTIPEGYRDITPVTRRAKR
jgi:hypothetical protein